MPYAAIDDNMTEHPKVERLSDAAFRAYVTSICFCSRNLTDGVVLKHQAPKVGASPKIIRELVDGRCWDPRKDGWYVHDYLEWNKSRAEVDAFRERQRAAGLASGSTRRSASGSTAGSANGSTAGSTIEPDVEPSSPLLSSRPDPAASSSRSARQWYEAATSKPAAPALRKELDELQTEHGFECIEWAFTEAIALADKPWPYARKILASCADVGSHGPRQAVEATAGDALEDEMSAQMKRGR